MREGGPAPRAAEPLLSDDERALLTRACQVILPATDTPGAVEAGVPEFVEGMLAAWFEADETRAFREGLARLDRLARERSGAPFAAAGGAVQVTVLAELESESLAGAAPGAPSLLGFRMGSVSAAPRAFFPTLKELVVVGYYTSEVGASQELARFVAGEYEPCVPYGEGGRLHRAWSE